jgi:hypothetical protein
MENDLTIGCRESHFRLIDYIPAEVQDAYQFLDLVWGIRNAFFNPPKTITLNRYRHLIHELSNYNSEESILCLDPLTDMTYSDQKNRSMFLSEETVNRFNNMMVLCVGLSGQKILELPIGHYEAGTGPTMYDRMLALPTEYGTLHLLFRIYRPDRVESESMRESFLRQVASNHPMLSIRTQLMLTDTHYPLEIVPSIGTRKVLESFACASPVIMLDDDVQGS